MKKPIYLITLILVVGIWLGINLAKDQPLFSNPFEDKDIREKATEKVENLGRGAKDAVENTLDRTFGR